MVLQLGDDAGLHYGWYFLALKLPVGPRCNWGDLVLSCFVRGSRDGLIEDRFVDALDNLWTKSLRLLDVARLKWV